MRQVLRAYGYVRTSVGEEGGGSTASIAAQTEAIEAHAAREGIEIVEIFHEPKVSGDQLMRPEFERMMDSATSAERPVDQIIVYNLTRFSRHLTARIASEQRLTQAQVELISVTEKFSQDAIGSLCEIKTTATVEGEGFERRTAWNTNQGNFATLIGISSVPATK